MTTFVVRRFPTLRRRPLFFAFVVLFVVSMAVAQEPTLAGTRVPRCAEPSKDQSLIGWGKYGLFFSVPKRGFKILGGKPDEDYVKFVIKPNKHEAALVLWFGGMAFHPDPPGETIRTSVSFTQTKLLNPNGTEIGLDSRGKKGDKSNWRWLGVWAEGGDYENASAEDARLFDQILDSACLIPYPSH